MNNIQQHMKQEVDAAFHEILSETGADAEDWDRFCCPSEIVNGNQDCLMWQPLIYNQSKMDQFMEFFHNSHFLTGSNPFPSRSIFIDIHFDFTIYNKLFDILQIYGHHIWHCYVEFWCKNSLEQEQGVLIFHKLLSLLPQLQTLRIGHVEHHWNQSTEYLKPILTANPMPKFKNLKLLTCHNTTGPLVSELVQKNPHIKGLRISELDFSNPSALLSTPLPNIQQFHILGYESTEDFSQFQTVQVHWQLTKLTFGFDIFGDETLKINHVFNWIEAQETLKELNISIPSSADVSEIDPLKLPNLITFRIKMWCYACLDFILPMSKSLVSLSVYHPDIGQFDDSLEKNSKIQFFVYMKNLGKSNIWKFFPRLRKIHFADDSVPELYFGRHYRRNHWVGFSLNGI